MSEFEKWKKNNCFSDDQEWLEAVQHGFDGAWNHQQKKIDAIKKHIQCIKKIVSECDEKTDSSWILGNIDGFIEGVEELLK